MTFLYRLGKDKASDRQVFDQNFLKMTNSDSTTSKKSLRFWRSSMASLTLVQAGGRRIDSTARHID